ncbi:MAG: hypothetical protein PHI76_01305 [Clostridia bacterium]|nr:hypothetical protein [Clostridia bacterium]
MFKNSIKLLLANFSSVWKLLLYKLIVVLTVMGLFWLTIPALSNLQNINELTESITTFLTTFGFNSPQISILNSLYAIMLTLSNVIVELVNTTPLLFLYIVFLFTVLLPFLWHFSDIAIGESLYGFMSSQTRYGFVGSMIRKLGVSVSYSLLFTLAVLPFNLVLLGGLVGILHLTLAGGLLAYLLPFMLFLLFLIVSSLKATFLSGWMPGIVVYSCNAITGFNKGIIALSRRFFRVWSTAIIFMFILLATVMFLGCYSLVILIPIASLFISIFNMAMFFGSQGMRFYVDLDSTIISPKRLEQTDKINRLKYVL